MSADRDKQARLDAIISTELELLERLIELTDKLCDAPSPSEDEVRAAYETRATISMELRELEKEAVEHINTLGAIPEKLKERADLLAETSRRALASQEKMTLKLDDTIKSLRSETAATAQAKRGIRSYGGPVSHRARFSDRKG